MPALLLVLVAVAGCRGEPATDDDPGLTRDEFAAVIVALREAEREALETDSAAAVFARRKEEILARHGTSEEEIQGFVDAASGDVPSLADLWEDISERLREPVEPDSL